MRPLNRFLIGVSFEQDIVSATLLKDSQTLARLSLGLRPGQARDLLLNQLIRSALLEAKIQGPIELQVVLVEDPELEVKTKSRLSFWPKLRPRPVQVLGSKLVRKLLKTPGSEAFQIQKISWKEIPFAKAWALDSFAQIQTRDAAIWLFPNDVFRQTELWIGHKGVDPVSSFSKAWELNLLLQAMCRFCGFTESRGEHQFMSLAGLGEPRFVEQIKALVEVDESSGFFNVDMSIVEPALQELPNWHDWEQLFGGEARDLSKPVSVRELDMACSFELVLKELFLNFGKSIRRDLGSSHLVISGNTTFSRLAFRVLSESGLFDKVVLNAEDLNLTLSRGAALSARSELAGPVEKVWPKLFGVKSLDSPRVSLDV